MTGNYCSPSPMELLDAMVLRYLKNRDIFMKTFPEGIDDINPDPFSLWAAIMISPQDDKPISDGHDIIIKNHGWSRTGLLWKK